MRLAILAVTILLAAGCGDSGDGSDRGDRADAASPQRSEAKPRQGGKEASTDARAQAVVRGWVDDLRRGDIDAATDRFAVPAVVANGHPELRLRTRAQIRLFNGALTCGSKVRDIRPHAGVLLATLELTDRPGGACGPGVGGLVRTAFEIRRGRIVRWIRLPDPEPPAGGSET
jgi:hypothetical protein